MKEDTSNSNPPAVTRALTILDYIAEHSPLSIKELSDILKIPHASTYRIVKCLLEFGYLRESPVYPDKYKLGYKPSILSKSAFDGADLIAVSKPYLKEMAAKTSQACQLCVLNDSYAINIDQSLPKDAITIIVKLGQPIPINASAAGKILTALLPETKRRDVLSNVWPSYKKNTDYTITDMELFLKHLEQISTQAYSTDFEEFAIGIGCIAVPVRDYDNNPIAAIGLTGPIKYYREPDSFNDMLNSLLDVSKKISKELYYMG
jgi:DNA-binding IclR family transcriptional regulator